jgi:Single Cache domain 2
MERVMLKQAYLMPAFVCLVGGLSYGSAAEYGTPEEALAMLKRAILEVKSDKRAAIQKFNYNNPAFRDRDLFVFCFRAMDGKFTAHEALIGADARKLRDPNGKHFGEEMYKKAEEDRISEIMYSSQLPGTSALADKRAYVTRIGGQVCGVSAYEFVSAP